MPFSPRTWAWVLGAVILAAAGLSTSVLRPGGEASPFTDMPAEDQVYWEWVRSIGSDGAAALESGLVLLAENPDQRRLYLRLADLCPRLEESNRCRSAIGAAVPSTPQAKLYRAAGLAALEGEPSFWKPIATSRDLDPALARRVVDHLRGAREAKTLEEVEDLWKRALSTDSMLAGASFGLGYAAVLRSDWDTAKPHLRRAAEAAPHDAHPFREYARMYYFTGNYAGFVEAMEKGIHNARQANDVEHEIILRGNLGLGYSQWEGDQEKAAEMFAASFEQAKILNMGRSVAVGGYRLANARARQHRYEEALELLDSVEIWYERAVPERMSEMLSLRGQILAKMYRFSEAETQIHASLANARAHGDNIREAQTLLALAELGAKIGKYDQAYAHADSALAIVTGYHAMDYVISARSLLGEVERLRGRYPTAEDHFRLGLATAASTDNRARIAEISRELAITALLVGDLDAAERHFDMAHENAGRTGLDRADALYFTANTYGYYQNYGLAARTYRRALDSLDAPAGSLSGRIKIRLAHVENSLGNPDTAMALLEDAAVLFKRDPLQGALINLVKGQILLRRKAYRAAFEAFQDAKTAPTWLTSHWEVHYGQALSLWGLNNLNRAETAFQRAIDDIESKRDEVHTTAGRSYFIYDRNTPYGSYAAFLEEQGRVEEAINVSERARSRGLVDLIYTTQTARGTASGDERVRAIDAVVRSRALQTERMEIEESGEDGGPRFEFVAEEQKTLAQSFARLEQSLRGSHPLYTFSPITLKDFQTVLHQDEAVLAYSLAEPGHFASPRSVVYIIRSDTFAAATLNSDASSVEKTIDLLNASIKESLGRTSRSWEAASRALFDLLIKPALPHIDSRITHLHLIPAGPMYYLPFSALLTETGNYLVEDYSLSVSPSLTILRLCRDRNPRTWKNVLILADPDEDLPGALHEARMIASMDTSTHILAAGPKATQALLEREAPHHDVIHLATHGLFQARKPLASQLKLYGNALTVDEIGRLKLDAYLVTLSACETALSGGIHGEQATGEEWVGLHQAFLAAGTPTVLASLWMIHDRYSGPLMSRFYSALSDNGKARALAEVQRGFISDERISHPYYWAGFVVIGDPL